MSVSILRTAEGPRWRSGLVLATLLFLGGQAAATGDCNFVPTPPKVKLGECPMGPVELTPGELYWGWVGTCKCPCNHGGLFPMHCSTKIEVLLDVGHFKLQCDLIPWGDTPCFGDTERPSTPPPAPPSGGPSPPQACSSGGLPVSVITGEMYFIHVDARVGALSFTRAYNTARLSPTTRHGSFGAGWNTSFDGRLRVMTSTRVEVRLDDGYPLYYYDDDADGDYYLQLPRGSESWIETVPDRKAHV